MKKLTIFIVLCTILGLNITMVYGGEEDLVKKLGSESYIEGRNAAEQIMERRTEFIPDLIVALRDPNWQLQAIVLNMLGQMEVKEAVPEIVRLLKDDNKIVRASAMWALGKIGDESAVAELKKVMLNDSDKDCRMAAAFSLGMLGSKKAIPYLKQALEDEDKTVKLRAAGSLGILGNDSGYNIAIKEMRNSNTEIKRYAIQAVGLIGKKKSVSVLNSALNDSHTGIQAEAKVALREVELKNLPQEKKIDYLEDSLKDKQIEVREWASRSLISQVKEKGVKEKLIKAAKDETNPYRGDIRKQLMIKGIKVD